MAYNWSEEIALITGASSGLGRALAVSIAEKGGRVVLLGRDLGRLKDVAQEITDLGGESCYYSFALQDVEQIKDLYQTIVADLGDSPTMLFNNAGYNAAGFVLNTPISVYERNMAVNVWAPVALVQQVVPGMLKNGHGTIVNVMSTAMYHSFPGISSYYASKGALKAVHQSLKAELAHDPIALLYVEPCGFTSSYGENIDRGNRFGSFKHGGHSGRLAACEVAREILDCLESGKTELIMGGIKDKLGYHLNYWFPRLVDRIIVKRNQALIQAGRENRE